MPNRGRSNYAQVNDLNVYYEIHGGEEEHMCRNIKALFNFEPPVNDGDVRADGYNMCARSVASTSHPKPTKSPLCRR